MTNRERNIAFYTKNQLFDLPEDYVTRRPIITIGKNKNTLFATKSNNASDQSDMDEFSDASSASDTSSVSIKIGSNRKMLRSTHSKPIGSEHSEFHLLSSSIDQNLLISGGSNQ